MAQPKESLQELLDRGAVEEMRLRLAPLKKEEWRFDWEEEDEWWARRRSDPELLAMTDEQFEDLEQLCTEFYWSAALQEGVSEEMVRLLFPDYCNIDISHEDSTPLLLHVASENPAALKYFVEAGADCSRVVTSMFAYTHDDAADSGTVKTGGRTALHEARTACAVPLLIGAGIEVDNRDMFLNTPLHLAARFGRTEVVAALLEAGADPHAQNMPAVKVHVDITPDNYQAPFETTAPGKTPLQLAEEHGRSEAASLLREFMERSSSANGP